MASLTALKEREWIKLAVLQRHRVREGEGEERRNKRRSFKLCRRHLCQDVDSTKTMWLIHCVTLTDDHLNHRSKFVRTLLATLLPLEFISWSIGIISSLACAALFFYYCSFSSLTLSHTLSLLWFCFTVVRDEWFLPHTLPFITQVTVTVAFRFPVISPCVARLNLDL